MKVIKYEAGKKPFVKEIENSLEPMQDEVDGFLECIYPWSENVVLVCNENGKWMKKPVVTILSGENGYYDVICGDFFICSDNEDEFTSIPEELVEKYLHIFDSVAQEIKALPSDTATKLIDTAKYFCNAAINAGTCPFNDCKNCEMHNIINTAV